jgi:hypothetical protein
MFVRDSCSKQLDSDRLAAYVPELNAYIFFYSGKTLRVHIFLFAGENYIRGIEHILFFFLFAGDNYIRGFPFFTFFTFFCEKKDLKIGFLKCANAGTPAVPYYYIYIYIYKKGRKETLYTPVSFQFFLFETKKFFTEGF